MLSHKCNCDCDLCNDCHDDDLLNIRLIECPDQNAFRLWHFYFVF